MKCWPVEAGMKPGEQQIKKWREPEMKKQGLNQPRHHSDGGDTDTTTFRRVKPRSQFKPNLIKPDSLKEDRNIEAFNSSLQPNLMFS